MTNEISATTYREWAKELGGLDDQIDALQDAKKEIYAKIRKDHSRVVAESMKNAIRLMRLDAGKRDEKMLVDEHVLKILAMLAQEDRPSRAAHAGEADLVEQHKSVELAGATGNETIVLGHEEEIILRELDEHDPDIGGVVEEPSCAAHTRETPVAHNDDHDPDQDRGMSLDLLPPASGHTEDVEGFVLHEIVIDDAA